MNIYAVLSAELDVVLHLFFMYELHLGYGTQSISKNDHAGTF